MKLTSMLAAAALIFAGTAAYAAEKMDCCKDGKCTCCTHKDEAKDPHKGMKH